MPATGWKRHTALGRTRRRPPNPAPPTRPFGHCKPSPAHRLLQRQILCATPARQWLPGCETGSTGPCQHRATQPSPPWRSGPWPHLPRPQRPWCWTTCTACASTRPKSPSPSLRATREPPAPPPVPSAKAAVLNMWAAGSAARAGPGSAPTAHRPTPTSCPPCTSPTPRPRRTANGPAAACPPLPSGAPPALPSCAANHPRPGCVAPPTPGPRATARRAPTPATPTPGPAPHPSTPLRPE